ncbi:type II toxin-antitoxin system HigB family toxin [Roseibacillus ishigakijimensis]|uniref:Type II toxin-antitoxin system HigB family toxin n=1 Tax=Roseibacillus ishigakijimensis TaxID=454146 RepID=A0A934RR17_9BACT|nr:type II toxin-antitoxin system HigB family toxin [Roseibacillus ishigakijimensis]MBK1835375.1 type II toxin-antitoxin system HigB family toxin [Roseibacillus ishigakijimensis]
MRIITEKALRDYGQKHPNAQSALANWITLARASQWKNLADLRKTYPHADPVTVASGNTVTVFNLAGNNHRLITAIHYNTGIIFALRILTHADYDKNHWKKEL